MLVPLFVLTVACAAAAPAAATTVRVKTFGSEDRTGEPRKRATVIVRAQGGERNRLRGVTTSGNKPQSVVIFDKAGVSPGRGCRRTSRRAVACRTGRFTVTDVDIVLGDRSDRATLDDFFPDGGVSVSAGRGDDRVISRSNFLGVYGGPGRDVLRSGGEAAFVGGPGDDRLFGGPGDDIFYADSAVDGSDSISGGRGDDAVSYEKRSGGVRADFAGDRDDGAAGERDRIGNDIEGLAGGSGDDVLMGDARGNDFDPGPGSDVVIAGAGSDSIGSDNSPPGDDAGDRLDGGAGADTIIGLSGPDTIAAGPGRDEVRAGGGDDRVDLHDGAFDDVDCGDGADAVTLDGFDFFINRDPRRPEAALDLFDPFFFRGFGGPCEQVGRNAPAGAVLLLRENETLPEEDGAVSALLGCPGDGPETCEGSARLEGSKVSGRGDPVAFSIPRDQGKFVKLSLGRQTPEARAPVPVTLVVETIQPGGGVSRLVYRARA